MWPQGRTLDTTSSGIGECSPTNDARCDDVPLGIELSWRAWSWASALRGLRGLRDGAEREDQDPAIMGRSWKPRVLSGPGYPTFAVSPILPRDVV